VIAQPALHEAVMAGHGYYNQHSVLQAAAADLGLAALRQAACEVPLPTPPEALVVADYGCSEGQNSLRPMGVAVAALRSRTPEAITVVHTDLPGNDFAAVFEAVAHDPSSYALVDDAAYVLAAGRSFYGPVLPPGTVRLGWSSITTHWLSTLPEPVPGHINAQIAAGAAGSRFAEQAAADWRAFLAARAVELAPGGRIVMVEPCAHPDGHIGSEPMMSLMDEALAELVADGTVSADAAATATLPVWLRTPDEYGAPIAAHPDLDVVSVQALEGFKSPLWAAFEVDGDAQAYAAAAVGSMRGWSEAMLADAIGDPAALDRFYARCRELGAADPERLHVQVFHVVLDFRRC
jgi:hypothetical protein